MNLLQILSIFILVEKTISSAELGLRRYASEIPLAVVKERNLFKLHLAIPYKDANRDLTYVYYDDPKYGNEKLMLAYPPLNNEKQSEIERQWKTKHQKSSESQLFFLSEYLLINNRQWDLLLKPTINRIEKKNTEGELNYCSQSQTELYEIGYQVSNDKGTDFQFLSTYKICYSKSKGATLYSIHRIQSPSLLLEDTIRELPDLDLLDADFSKPYKDLNERLTKIFERKVI